jgi:TNF receptor-associated factor 2
MSLFFVIMRGEYDDNLQWPFEFKVKFSLIDQLAMNDDQHHINQFCWPNSTTGCFERPNTSMNVPCGIALCFPLHFFKQNQNRFVQNDTMFIKFEIDVLAERPSKMSISENIFICFCFSLTIDG